jgi:hypothetical protein
MLPLAAGFAVACVLYAVGWFLEDTDHWLAPGAVALWGAVLPIWLGVVAFMWRTRRAAWLVGLGIALIMLGIAGIYSALALVGWLAGRSLHIFLRRRRIRPQAE